jgi:hypothetical protein
MMVDIVSRTGISPQ